MPLSVKYAGCYDFLLRIAFILSHPLPHVKLNKTTNKKSYPLFDPKRIGHEFRGNRLPSVGNIRLGPLALCPTLSGGLPFSGYSQSFVPVIPSLLFLFLLKGMVFTWPAAADLVANRPDGRIL